MTVASVEVVVADRRWTKLRGVRKIAAAGVTAALEASGVAIRHDGEASVLLADDEAVAALNRQWRGKPLATNVLSFPAVAPTDLPLSPVIGDIALAYETCAREAEEAGKTLKAHLTHLVVHGALHLAGHDHETAAKAEAMEALERHVLARLGIADPYGSDVPVPEAVR